jgi:prepilin-type N-terminal cleavage/methylation domain-containing protein
MKTPPRHGFTLFEMLIALAIVVILVGVMSSTINIAFKQKLAAERAIEAVRDIQAVGDLMVDELGNAAPPTPATQPTVGGMAVEMGGIEADSTEVGLGSLGAGNGTAGGLGAITTGYGVMMYGAFVGDSQSISFFTTGPEPRAPLQHDARWVQYSLDKADDGADAVIRLVDTNLLADEADPNPAREVLIKNVRNVAFRYWDGTQWLDAWDSTVNSDTLPYAVSIELTLDPLEENGPERVIKRFASIWCAAPAAISDTTGIVTPGLGN